MDEDYAGHEAIFSVVFRVDTQEQAERVADALKQVLWVAGAGLEKLFVQAELLVVGETEWDETGSRVPA